MIAGLAREQVRDLILSVGTHHSNRPLTPVEIAKYFQQALDAGASREEIAESCLLETTTMIGRFLKLLKLDDELQHLVVFGAQSDSLSFTQAMEMVRVDNDKQLQLAQAVLENSLTKDEIREICQLARRSDQTIDQSVAQIVKLRPTIVRNYVYVGKIDDDQVKSLLTKKTQIERDQLLAESLLLVEYEGSGHLGVSDFTLSSQVEQDVKASQLKSVISSLVCGGEA